MTEITFHFNVFDSLDHSCRLLRKAYLKGSSVVVTGEATMLAEIDIRLWSLDPSEFVPHCSQDAEQPTLQASPIVLCASLGAIDHDGVLINVGQKLPDAFERFERLIEVVTSEETDRLAGRQRWKHYAGRGYVLKRHDFALKSGPI